MRLVILHWYFQWPNYRPRKALCMHKKFMTQGLLCLHREAGRSKKKLAYATICCEHTVLFSKRRKDSLLCAHSVARWFEVGVLTKLRILAKGQHLASYPPMRPSVSDVEEIAYTSGAWLGSSTDCWVVKSLVAGNFLILFCRICMPLLQLNLIKRGGKMKSG